MNDYREVSLLTIFSRLFFPSLIDHFLEGSDGLDGVDQPNGLEWMDGIDE